MRSASGRSLRRLGTSSGSRSARGIYNNNHFSALSYSKSFVATAAPVHAQWKRGDGSSYTTATSTATKTFDQIPKVSAAEIIKLGNLNKSRGLGLRSSTTFRWIPEVN